jgi:hypothetical protein
MRSPYKSEITLHRHVQGRAAPIGLTGQAAQGTDFDRVVGAGHQLRRKYCAANPR